MKKGDPLFAPVTVAGKLALRNRIVLAPLWLVWDGRSDEVVPCLWDNAGCLRNSTHCGLPIRCNQNPLVGFAHEVY